MEDVAKMTVLIDKLSTEIGSSDIPILAEEACRKEIPEDKITTPHVDLSKQLSEVNQEKLDTNKSKAELANQSSIDTENNEILVVPVWTEKNKNTTFVSLVC